MYVHKNLITVLLLSASNTVLADGAAIKTAVSGITNTTIELGSTVTSWDGNLLTFVTIGLKSYSLVDTINKGTATSKQSANLTDIEALDTGFAVSNLVKAVNSTMTTIIEAKSKFDENGVSLLVQIALEMEKDSSASLSNAIIEKLPPSFVDTGKLLSAEIAASFEQTIGAFTEVLT